MTESTSNPAPGTQPSPAEARELLLLAGQLGAASAAGASWPHVTMLLGLGAISALSLIGFGLVGVFDESYVGYPLTAMLIWLGIFMVTMLWFGRSTKKGFNNRWGIYMAIWAALWTFGVVVGLFFFEGEMWFFVLAAALITAATTACGWIEARR